MEDNFTIGIIGGAGKMGRLFKSFFEKRGFPVVISDKKTGLRYEELLEVSKVIILSLPMEIFPEVVETIAPRIKEDHWIMDICSLKLEPAKVMKRNLKRGELLATHPLFGPFERDLRGKIVALYPLRGRNFHNWLRKILTEEGLKVVKIPPKKHDEIMGLVQVLNHFWLLLLGKVLHDSKLPLKEVISLSTPSFLGQLQILKRLALQDEKLYARIQLENPFGNKFRKLLCQNCQKLARKLSQRDNFSYETFYEAFNVAQRIAKEVESLIPAEIKD
ncbi:MAG: prephenate dehydrogenase/arogenate dehydrogenase family protein [Caldimicrobium sp.]|nr:prephenate dehydrogenase/arogenate dehydrogenase family protein [Caldimicrobium sp.]MCX7613401.1 prephenate dehydrogenase/arogenate dehydrogenase family protein [Caldimicrobium sp.]MDW8182381.1 prephenate dehydrogenase/arogenate dehydrogenase family protein [Caldimicrobium sp.]